MFRRTALPCLLLAVLALAVPSMASAASYTVGVSDQQASTFTNPLFAPLKMKVARYITPYDVLKDPVEKAKLDSWLTAARAAKQETLVSFEHSRRGSLYKHTPSASEYRSAMVAFKKKYNGKVQDISPWNEVNVCQAAGRTEGQPSKICKSSTGAKIVAGYYKTARSVFKGKKIVGIDILDGFNVGGAVSYLKKFKQYARPLPKYWGIHNYSDTNRGSTSRTSRLLKTIGSRSAQIWLTETGGQLKLRGKDYGQAKAAKALECMFSMPKKFKQIKRLYVYQFNGAPPANDFDAGLIGTDNTKRLGYSVVQKRKSATCRP
jgi:hypothetical protein